MVNPLGMILGFLGKGGAQKVLNPVQQLVRTFAPDAENQANRDYQLGTQVHNSYTREFTQGNRTYWDAFVESINKLIRPTIVVTLLAPLIILMLAGFFGWSDIILNVSAAFTAMALIPENWWFLIICAVGFYLPLRSADKAYAKKIDAQQQAAVAKTVIQTVKQIHDLKPGLAAGNDDIREDTDNPVLAKHGV